MDIYKNMEPLDFLNHVGFDLIQICSPGNEKLLEIVDRIADYLLAQSYD